MIQQDSAGFSGVQQDSAGFSTPPLPPPLECAATSSMAQQGSAGLSRAQQGIPGADGIPSADAILSAGETNRKTSETQQKNDRKTTKKRQKHYRKTTENHRKPQKNHRKTTENHPLPPAPGALAIFAIGSGSGSRRGIEVPAALGTTEARAPGRPWIGARPRCLSARVPIGRPKPKPKPKPKRSKP